MVAKRVLIIVVVVTLLSIGADATTVAVSGRNVLVNGQTYFMKGVGYSVVPIGHAPGDGYDPFTVPGIYNRDMANLKRMGANTIRIYGWTNGQDYDAFLNTSLSNGIYVLVGYYFTGLNISDSDAVSSFQASWVSMINTYKHHPAIIMWILGNEENGAYPENTEFYTFLNNMCGAAHTADSTRLCSTTFLDNNLQGPTGMFAQGDSIMTNLDIYNVQLYRGKSFFGFFSDYQLRSSKPIFVTEFGCDAYNTANSSEDTSDQTLYDVSLWNELVANNNVTSGGLVFEYADEWWKCQGTGYSDTVHDTCGGQGNEPDNVGSNEWYGLFSIAPNPTSGQPDILTARPIVASLTVLWGGSGALPTTGPTTGGSPTAGSPTAGAGSPTPIKSHGSKLDIFVALTGLTTLFSLILNLTV